MPLGLMPEMSYEEKEVTLDAGDGTLFYSDGLVEAHDSQRGEMFGFPRLRELVAEHDEEQSLGDFLVEKLYSFVGGRLRAATVLKVKGLGYEDTSKQRDPASGR